MDFIDEEPNAPIPAGQIICFQTWLGADWKEIAGLARTRVQCDFDALRDEFDPEGTMTAAKFLKWLEEREMIELFPLQIVDLGTDDAQLMEAIREQAEDSAKALAA